MDAFFSYLSLIFSGIVAVMFVIFIVYFLEYGYGEGEAVRRAEAVSRIIWAASVVMTIAVLWVILKVGASILAG
jgi:hypothetical protein